MSEKLTLVSPWVNFYREIESLFKRDNEVRVVFEDGDEKVIKLYVDSTDKATALEKIMPKERTFGNVTVKVIVIPNNDSEEWNLLETFAEAFKDNPVFAETKERISQLGSFKYVMFNDEVVQYPNDDISDANLIRSTLYQDIAKDVFEDLIGHVFFSTMLSGYRL